MSNSRLYQSDVYAKEAAAELMDVKPSANDGGKAEAKENLLDLLPEPCIFFPTGGGQSCDRGSINGMPVLDVYEDENKNVWCTVSAAEAHDGKGLPKKGDMLDCVLDWEHRFDNMQRHCGEHILSGVFDRLYGAVNRGFHMGSDYMTIDMSLEKDESVKSLNWDMAMKAELEANKVIWRNEPVVTYRFKTREEAAKMPLRKPLAFDEDISIVCVGDKAEASDCVACCGTHPAYTGQVGLIKIFKMENYKGMYRIYCEAGQRAFAGFDKMHEIVTELNRKYSASTYDLLEKIADADRKTQQLKDDYYNIKNAFLGQLESGIKAELSGACENAEGGTGAANRSDSAAEAKKPIIRQLRGVKADDVLPLGKTLCKELKRLLVIRLKESGTVLLFSDGKAIDCAGLVKQHAFVYNGKGGGSAASARAIFANAADEEKFINILVNNAAENE